MEDKFYNSALRFLSYRPRSEKEVREKLKSKKVETSVIEKIIAKLIDKKFINDEEFAKSWIEQRLKLKPRSLRLIKIELKQKGIDSEVIDKLINDEGLMINDLDNAKKLIERKMSRSRNKFGMTPEKLGRYLASKGFDWDTVKKSIDESLGKGV